MPGEEIRTWHGHVHEETYFSEKIYYLFRNISKLDENYIKLAEKVIKSCNFASQQNLRRHCKQTKWGNLKSLWKKYLKNSTWSFAAVQEERGPRKPTRQKPEFESSEKEKRSKNFCLNDASSQRDHFRTNFVGQFFTPHFAEPTSLASKEILFEKSPLQNCPTENVRQNPNLTISSTMSAFKPFTKGTFY